jgi:hypothetical protein
LSQAGCSPLKLSPPALPLAIRKYVNAGQKTSDLLDGMAKNETHRNLN